MKYVLIENLPTDSAYLHFEATRQSYNMQVDYELVIPLDKMDCRGTWDHKGRRTRPKNHRIVWLDTNNNKRIPLGRTNVDSSNSNYPFTNRLEQEEIDLPFRDGAHCGWDNKKLGVLPIIYSVDGKHYSLITEIK